MPFTEAQIRKAQSPASRAKAIKTFKKTMAAKKAARESGTMLIPLDAVPERPTVKSDKKMSMSYETLLARLIVAVARESK